jgi:inhibitor of KinA sporulation pathway (predicted exonuclease)|tara:strand:+ start:2894 stop:3214 length:321 start_codon:yes stop_codon:yes gene_type:complete
MATTTIAQTELTLIDGSTIVVRPLKVSLLREFLKKFGDITEVATDNDASMTILMECVQIAMRQYKPELADDLSALEDVLDLPTVYRVVEAASGIVLDDANVITTAS